MYLETTLTTKKEVHNEITEIINYQNPSHSVQKLLSSCLLSKKIILPVVVYGGKVRPLTLMKEHKLQVLKNKVLRRKKIFGSKRGDRSE